jgi:PKD repeat protein
MNLMSPAVACISVGDGQSTNWYHPRMDVVENVLLANASCITAPASMVLQTEEGSPTGSLTSYAGYCVGDIVISTAGVDSYSITASGAVSQGPDERTSAGLPATFYFDEVSGGDTPAIISNVHEENVTETGADIVWTTNENADSTVHYGTTSGSYPNSLSDATMALSHRLTLTNLTANTTYYYVVESVDSGSNVSTSNEFSFVATTPSSGSSDVVFSEIYYDTVGTDADEEWIELYNKSAATVDVGGWIIIDNNGTGSSYTIPSNTTIAAGTYLTIAANSIGFNALYGFDADVYGSIPALNNTGDTLLLRDGSSTEVDAVAWEGGATSGTPATWGSATNPVSATGSSITRTDPAVDTDTYADWSVVSNNGDPQTQSTTPPSGGGDVVFSEIYYDTIGTDADEEWIELYNKGTTSVNIGGWTIIDNNGTGSSYTFPANTTIASGTYFTVAANSNGFTAIYGYAADIYGSIPALNNTGDTLLMRNASAEEVDTVAWEGGASSGIPTGWGSTSAPSASTGSAIERTSVTTDTDTYADWSTVANNGDPQTQIGGTPSAPVADFSASVTTVTEGDTINFTDLSTNSPNSWSWTFTGGTPTSSSSQNPAITYNTAGTYSVTLQATNSGGNHSETKTSYITVNPIASSGLVFETGTVSSVGNSWQTVNLANTYTSMVVVCSSDNGTSGLPAVTRVQNASGNSFQVMVQNPSGTALSGYAVHYFIVEEGVYTVANDGINMEAVKVTSSVTANSTSWAMEARSYQNSYSSPVVVGQVMTYNDSNWSVFWASSSSRMSPPSASAFSAGKHVGEDSNQSRANETIAYVVIEQGEGTVNGVPYAAAVGSDIVKGPDNTSTGYTYTFNSIPTASTAILSAAAMDGNNGGWPVLYGSSPLTSTSMLLVFEEDQIKDSERKHGSEQVAYIVFGQ